jgi:hypothetical protein
MDQPGDRNAYAPPSLKEFGPVGALTQGSTRGVDETADMMAHGQRMS